LLAKRLKSDKKRLYRPGGLTELREQGLVRHHPKIGFFSPHAPPPEHASALAVCSPFAPATE
jgi:hypothetical protein